uniref:Ccdc32_1 protein n=1 Tax=Fopius arisanus TaxID=64838 RepID=A0A0C9PVG8_9HYME
MKTLTVDPWGPAVSQNEVPTSFEDSFVTARADLRLDDSDQYLQRLYSRLRQVQGGTSKKDLVKSLSQVKEDTIARLITSGRRLDPEEEAILGSNPLLRHITPHLQVYPNINVHSSQAILSIGINGLCIGIPGDDGQRISPPLEGRCSPIVNRRTARDKCNHHRFHRHRNSLSHFFHHFL